MSTIGFDKPDGSPCTLIMKGPVEIGQKWYRVTLVVAFLGWVDYDVGHSTTCPVLLGQMGVWLNPPPPVDGTNF